jgi:hypothetical protein
VHDSAWLFQAMVFCGGLACASGVEGASLVLG